MRVIFSSFKARIFSFRSLSFSWGRKLYFSCCIGIINKWGGGLSGLSSEKFKICSSKSICQRNQKTKNGKNHLRNVFYSLYQTFIATDTKVNKDSLGCHIVKYLKGHVVLRDFRPQTNTRNGEDIYFDLLLSTLFHTRLSYHN